MPKLLLAFSLVLAVTVAGQGPAMAPDVLPPLATRILAESLQEARTHKSHMWRDTAPENADGTINAYIEISRGDRRKFEFDMAANKLALDRMMPEDVGGYPINYGYVPQTVSYDGDPFDALVLGPPLREGQLVRGIPVGVMFMEDEKGLDSKVVLARLDANGRPMHELTGSVQQDVGTYFRGYKRHEPGGFSRVPGWGSADEGRALVRLTHAFFRGCREKAGMPCTVRYRP